MKMNPDCEDSQHGLLSTADRLSNLPDFIIHHIISLLGTKEAYRTCILSKRWGQVSATNPILVFRSVDFTHGGASAFLDYIDTRMKRYASENLRIRELTVTFLGFDVGLASLLDESLAIAVHNQVESLVLELGTESSLHRRGFFLLEGPCISKYELPGILLSAKSLRQFDCSLVKIPYYKAINLVSLESLVLCDVVVKDHMLYHIIRSCLLLKHLKLSFCSGFKYIAIPSCSTLKTCYLTETLPTGGKVSLQTSTLESFGYVGKPYSEDVYPVISKAGLLRNLRNLHFSNVTIEDDDFRKVLSELTLLETLKLCQIHKLYAITISSAQLKDIYLNDCTHLFDIGIDAPCLKMFKYKGDFDPGLSITINSQANCDISLQIRPFNLVTDGFDTEGFVKLKKLLTGVSNCNVFEILLLDEFNQYECHDIDFDIEFDEGELENGGPPCDIRELKLTLSSTMLLNSLHSAFLDGLFWTCHPDLISLRVESEVPHVTVEPLISELEDMAKRLGHPLKHVELIGDANCSKLLESKKLYAQLRLYW